MKKRIIITGILLATLTSAYFLLKPGNQKEEEVFVKVKKGKFRIAVTNSGEIYAKNSVNIQGPDGLRTAQIWQVKISSIVPEGTIVQEGEEVATLDRSELVDKLRSKQGDLDKATSQYTQTKLDTTLELREARDNLVNLKFAMEEKKLELQQSKFEPPATVKKAEIEVEKAERTFKQAQENYQIKKNKAVAKMQEAAATLEQASRTVEFLESLMDDFSIKAPKSGMMIYARSWDGGKRREGSTIGPWEPTVATLPDMSVMVSRTYINEVDIRKIKNGQKVEIGLDAFPEKKLTGRVIEVANVGEQKPNSDAKVFEVNIEINERDSLLLPAMTTSNIIIAEEMKSILFIPLESVHSQGDSLTYVFKRSGSGLVRQQVKIGKTNDNEAEVLKGLTENEEVLMSKPKEPEKYRLVALKEEKYEIDKKKNNQKLQSKK